jgi:formylglycine-generating enzyme required for sulfatase activity
MSERLARRLTTILAADVAGYSGMMAADEEGTIRRFAAARAILDPLIARFGGRIFNTAGDAVLAEFPSAVNAVRAALAAQKALAAEQAALAEDRRVRFRMGIQVGDVVPQGDDLLGDGVNVAARLQQAAPPGGIVIGRTVAEQIEGKLDIALADLGDLKVKGIPRPIRAYRLDPGGATTPQPPDGNARRRRLLFGAAAALAVVAAGAYLARGPIERWLEPPEPLPANAVRDCDDCPVLMPIAAGTYLRGAMDEDAEAYDSERPQRPVRIGRPFLLGRAEVTVAEFERFARETGHPLNRRCHDFDFRVPDWVLRTGIDRRHPGFPQGPDHPVVCVSWLDAKAYVAWLARKTGKPYRLPTEAEWEYAARLGHDKARPGPGAANLLCAYANVADRTMEERFRIPLWKYHECADGFSHTAPVGRFPPNQSGLVDMIGNVWEWVEDCFADGYEKAPVDGSAAAAASCASRVMRGGAWISEQRQSRFSMRGHRAETDSTTATGFRVARDP